jgi:hypothetical protein
MFSTTLANQRLDQSLLQLAMMGEGMIGRITLKHFRPFTGPTPLAADGWNRLLLID